MFHELVVQILQKEKVCCVLILFQEISGIFPSIFYSRYSVVKTQSSIEFQNSIFRFLLFQELIFHLQLWSSIPHTLSTIKPLQRRIYFQCFFTLEVHFLTI